MSTAERYCRVCDKELKITKPYHTTCSATCEVALWHALNKRAKEADARQKDAEAVALMTRAISLIDSKY